VTGGRLEVDLEKL